MRLTVGEFARRCGGVARDVDLEAGISGFALDSREAAPGSLFLAIRGARSDGHDHVAQALAAGAVAAIVERPVAGPRIEVPDLVEALARFATGVRDRFPGPVVGVTGSNGKTATKEFAAAALSPLGPVLKSPGNRNTEYTAPLVWADLEADHRAVVAEMAMRGFGQIAHLAEFTKPTCAIVTMIGTSHIEMVGSREGIARAKGEILTAAPPAAAVLWNEDDFFPTLRAMCAPETRVSTFGFRPEADGQVVGYRALSWDRCVVRARIGTESAEFELPTVGRHQALNAVAALLAASASGVGVSQAAGALGAAALPPLRMQPVDVHGATVLLDTYNASPDSTIAAIRTLTELPCSGRRFAVIGEMRELGDYAESGHRQVGRALAEAALDGAVLVGELTRFTLSEALRAGMPPHLVEERGLDLLGEFLGGLAPGDVCLMKGSRALGLESALEQVREVEAR